MDQSLVEELLLHSGSAPGEDHPPSELPGQLEDEQVLQQQWRNDVARMREKLRDLQEQLWQHERAEEDLKQTMELEIFERVRSIHDELRECRAMVMGAEERAEVAEVEARTAEDELASVRKQLMSVVARAADAEMESVAALQLREHTEDALRAELESVAAEHAVGEKEKVLISEQLERSEQTTREAQEAVRSVERIAAEQLQVAQESHSNMLETVNMMSLELGTAREQHEASLQRAALLSRQLVSAERTAIEASKAVQAIRNESAALEMKAKAKEIAHDSAVKARMEKNHREQQERETELLIDRAKEQMRRTAEAAEVRQQAEGETAPATYLLTSEIDSLRAELRLERQRREAFEQEIERLRRQMVGVVSHNSDTNALELELAVSKEQIQLLQHELDCSTEARASEGNLALQIMAEKRQQARLREQMKSQVEDAFRRGQASSADYHASQLISLQEEFAAQQQAQHVKWHDSVEALRAERDDLNAELKAARRRLLLQTATQSPSSATEAPAAENAGSSRSGRSQAQNPILVAADDACREVLISPGRLDGVESGSNGVQKIGNGEAFETRGNSNGQNAAELVAELSSCRREHVEVLRELKVLTQEHIIASQLNDELQRQVETLRSSETSLKEQIANLRVQLARVGQDAESHRAEAAALQSNVDEMRANQARELEKQRQKFNDAQSQPTLADENARLHKSIDRLQQDLANARWRLATLEHDAFVAAHNSAHEEARHTPASSGRAASHLAQRGASPGTHAMNSSRSSSPHRESESRVHEMQREITVENAMIDFDPEEDSLEGYVSATRTLSRALAKGQSLRLVAQVSHRSSELLRSDNARLQKHFIRHLHADEANVVRLPSSGVPQLLHTLTQVREVDPDPTLELALSLNA